ncbi:MAG: serine kinase [Pseudomonadota bacterium]
MCDYHLFGWRVQSALPLSELLAWRGDARAPDIIIEIGAVPPVDSQLPSFSPAVQICPTGVRIAIPAVASYWVEAGRRVIVQPILPEDAVDIRVFLLGTVLAVLCFQRGLLPMHASAVDTGGRVLLLSGESGAGKSTLAAAFSARGYRLLSDDLCALEVREGQPLMVLPAFPRVKLWRDSARRLQVPIDGLERSREELDKFNVPLLEARFQPNALPPAKIVFLRRERPPEKQPLRRLSGVEALRRYDLVHRWRLGLVLGYQASIFKAMARLIEAVPVLEVARSDNFDDLPALVDKVRALGEMSRG